MKLQNFSHRTVTDAMYERLGVPFWLRCYLTYYEMVGFWMESGQIEDERVNYD